MGFILFLVAFAIAGGLAGALLPERLAAVVVVLTSVALAVILGLAKDEESELTASGDIVVTLVLVLVPALFGAALANTLRTRRTRSGSSPTGG